MIPNIPLIMIMYLSQVINGIMLPIILVMMLLIINNKKVMGEYVNGKWFNIAAWGSAIALSILSIMLVLQLLKII